MSVYVVTVEMDLTLRTTESGDAAINRFVGLTREQGRALATTPGLSREQVIAAMIGARLKAGLDPNELEGFTALTEDDIDISITFLNTSDYTESA